jgi:hypothetical protein
MGGVGLGLAGAYDDSQLVPRFDRQAGTVGLTSNGANSSNVLVVDEHRHGLAESALYRLAPVVEDPLEVAADDRAVEKLAERPERERIADAVAHDHVVSVRLEAVDMVPVAVGPAELPVGEAVRRIPVLDPADPPDRNAVQPEAVFDLGPAGDRHGRVRHPEVEPRRCDLLEVMGVGEELEHVCDVPWDPLAALEQVESHRARRLGRPGRSADATGAAAAARA